MYSKTQPSSVFHIPKPASPKSSTAARTRYYLAAVLLLLLCAGGSLSAQILRPFTIRYNVNGRSKLVFVTNNIITSKGTGTDYGGLPPNCGTATGNAGKNCRNDSYQGTNIDIDGDPSTLNSSSATLELPPCNTVSYAGLYWGAGLAKDQGNNGPNPLTVPNQNLVKFKVPGGTYQTITASAFDSVNTIFQGYQGYADVTALVQKGGGGSYTIADVKCDTNKVNSYGGWTLVVAVRDSLLPVRNLTVFDGIAVIGSSGGAVSGTQFTVTGFKAPPTGAINCTVGVMCYDGDRGPTDSFQIKQNSNGLFRSQTDAGESANPSSNTNDAWNSSITNVGSNVTTRTPAHSNTYGYDSDMFQLSNTTKNYLNNNDSSLTIRIGSPSEGYILGLVTTQIDAFNPELILQTTGTDVNGGSYELGDTILLKSTLRNTGSDTAVGALVLETLPVYFKYVPNTIEVGGVAKTDATGDDVAEYTAANRTVAIRVGTGANTANGGRIRSTSTDTFSFLYRVVISNSCADIGNTPVNLLRQSRIVFRGNTNTAPDSAVSRPVIAADPCVAAPAPDTARLMAGCPLTPLSAARLISWTHTQNEDATILKWSVREEAQMQGYRIERGAPGTGFKVLENLVVALTDGVQSYTYTDAAPLAPEGWYRIAGTEITGQQWYSPVLVVKHKTALTQKPVLAPNPGTNALNFSRLAGGETVELFSLQGQLLATQQVPANTTATSLSTESLLPGIYLVQVRGKGETAHYRWVKE